MIISHRLTICLLAGWFCHYITKVSGEDLPCEILCARMKDTERFGVDLNNKQKLRSTFDSAKQAYINKLKEDYGEENYRKMFRHQGESMGRYIFKGPTQEGQLAWERMKRKFMIKILQVQTAISKERRRRRDECECIKNTDERHRGLGESNDTDKIFYSDFIWANGGSTISAGHGNFFRESYTAVLERAVKPIFDAIGIDFTANNNAIGGMSSFEFGWCIESIFGKYFDVLTWDFGIDDNKGYHSLVNYLYHAALTARHPAVVGFFGKSHATRLKIAEEMESIGMTIMYLDGEVHSQQRLAIPDTLELSEEEQESMPPYVQGLKCGNRIEDGDPACTKRKYNRTICADRRLKAGWHEGWKVHALEGNNLALFVVNVLDDAIKELAKFEGSERRSKLRELREAEALDYANINENEFPKIVANNVPRLYGTTKLPKLTNKDKRDFYKQKTFCHLAMLPSDMRSKNLLSSGNESSNHATAVEFQDMMYWQKIKNTSNYQVDQGEFNLVYDGREREPCEEVLQKDFKDYWLVTSYEKKKFLTIPNDAEIEHYGLDYNNTQHMILACFGGCPIGRCKKGDAYPYVDVHGNSVKFKINGVNLYRFVKMGSCHVVLQRNGVYWPANNEGKYEIEVSVKSDQMKYIKIRNFIIV